MFIISILRTGICWMDKRSSHSRTVHALHVTRGKPTITMDTNVSYVPE